MSTDPAHRPPGAGSGPGASPHPNRLPVPAGLWDAQALALDFLSLGFRECLMEASRYLGSVEGLDSGDPLRSRLLSHLSSCASQRDAAALTAPQSSPLPHPFLPHCWAADSAPSLGSSHTDSSSSSLLLPCTPTPLPTPLLSLSFPVALHGEFHVLPPSFSAAPPSSSSSQAPPSSSKPYRPWGSELGAS